MYTYINFYSTYITLGFSLISRFLVAYSYLTAAYDWPHSFLYPRCFLALYSNQTAAGVFLHIIIRLVFSFLVTYQQHQECNGQLYNIIGNIATLGSIIRILCTNILIDCRCARQIVHNADHIFMYAAQTIFISMSTGDQPIMLKFSPIMLKTMLTLLHCAQHYAHL